MTPIDPTTLPLRDIHLPAPIGWWPPAPGWWLLAFVSLAGPLCALAWWTWRRRTRLRREALARLASLRQSAGSPHQTAMAVSLLLREISIALDAAQPQSSLQGERWLARLDAIAPGLTQDPALRGALLTGPYDPQISFDTGAFLAAVERWIRRLPQRRLRVRHV